GQVGGGGAGGVPGVGGAAGTIGGGGAAGGAVGCNSTIGGGLARFAYAAAADSSQIFSYTVEASTGALTASGTPALTSGPRQLTVDPSKKFLLVASFGTLSTCGTGCALVS